MVQQRLAIIIHFNAGGEASSVSSIAFGHEDAQEKKAQMIEDIKAQGFKPFDSEIIPDAPRPFRKPGPSAVS